MYTVVSRLLVQFNSSVNPIVYATTIPEFKKTIKDLFSGFRRKEDNLERSQTTKATRTQ